MNINNAMMGLAGGALIGLSASLLLLTRGRIAGISGILAGSASGPERHWKRLFLGGLVWAESWWSFSPSHLLNFLQNQA